MPKPLSADWNAIGVLAASGVTLKELSKRTGISLDTLKTRSRREGWKSTAKTVKAANIAASASAGQMETSAADGLALVKDTLTERKDHTKLGLSLYAARAARVASRLPKGELLDRSSDIRAVADVMGKVWREPYGGVAVGIQVNLGRGEVG